MKVILMIVTILSFVISFFLSSHGHKKIITNYLIKNQKRKKVINKINSLVLLFIMSLVYIFVLIIMVKIITLTKIISGAVGVQLILTTIIIFYIVTIILGIFNLVKQPKQKWNKMLIDFLWFIPLIIIIILIITSFESFQGLKRNFITDAKLYFSPAISLANINSPGYNYFNLGNFNLMELIFKHQNTNLTSVIKYPERINALSITKYPDTTSWYFYASWLKLFNIKTIFEAKLLYMFGFSFIGWCAFLQSLELFIKNKVTYLVTSVLLLIIFMSFDYTFSWDLAKITYIMQFISSFIATSVFLNLIFLTKNYFKNFDLLIFFIAPIILIIANTHTSILMIYLMLLAIILMKHVFTYIVKKLTKFKLNISIKFFNTIWNWKNILISIIILIITFLLVIVNKYVKVNVNYCKINPCELGFDTQFRWKGSFLLIIFLYILLLNTKDNFSKYFYTIVTIMLIFTRFHNLLSYIDEKYFGLDFALKRQIVYTIFMCFLLVLIDYLNKFTNNKLKQGLILIITFLFMFNWNGIHNLKMFVSTYKNNNVFKNITPIAINENQAITQFLLDKKIEQSSLVAEVNGFESEISDYQVNSKADFDNLPISTIGSENWNLIIQYQAKKSKINQFNNIFIPQKLIIEKIKYQNKKNWNNEMIIKKLSKNMYEVDPIKFMNYLNSDFYKIYKIKKIIKTKGYGLNGNFYWFERINKTNTN